MPNRRFLLAGLVVFALVASALQAANIPRQAPDFAINLTNGSKISLGQYKGKVVALLFLLTTCPHCQKAVRCLIEDQKEFGPRGFQALGSAIESTAKADVPNFVRRFNPPFPIGWNDLRPALDFMQHPAMVGPRMPLIAFIDRAGILRAQYEGYEPFFAEEDMAKNIRAKILELLEGSNPQKPPAAPARSKRGASAKRK